VAVDAARRPRLSPLPLSGRALDQLQGQPTNLVTEMDRGAETIVVEAIRARFPDHADPGRGDGALPGAPAQPRIVTLDGTTNYAHGLPSTRCRSARGRGELAVGVVYDPSARCFVAERGRGATLNDAPIRVSTTPRMAESLSAPATQRIPGRRATTSPSTRAHLPLHSVRSIGSRCSGGRGGRRPARRPTGHARGWTWRGRVRSARRVAPSRRCTAGRSTWGPVHHRHERRQPVEISKPSRGRVTR